MTTAPAPDDDDTIGALIAPYHREDELLPALHAIQDALGYVPDPAIKQIAEKLNLSRADVHGTIGFYHHFRKTPPGRHVLRVCRAEACQAVGSRALEQHITRCHGLTFHDSSEDGLFSLEPVYCLGNCALGPAMMVDNDLHARVTPDRFDRLVSGLRGQQSREGKV